MDEVLWRLFVDAKIAEYYFSSYARRSNLYVFLFNALCLVASLTGTAAWITSYLQPLFASLVILSSQILCTLQPLYPFSKRLYAANCIHAAYGEASLRAEQLFNRYLYGSLTLQDLPDAVETLQTDMANIEGKFSSISDFPPKMRFHKRAEASTLQYIDTHFNSGG